jgi:succinoglycan biosynthesis transport protein ExoP
MKKSRLKNLNDVLALLVRRRWCVVIPTVVFCGLAILITLVFPRIYQSKTMILIQPRDVPSEFVKDLIGGNTDERLSAIEQTILSRTNLLKILSEFEDRLPGYRGINDERRVAKLKKRIVIEFPSERRRGIYLPTTNILISYRDQNPELAQKITARLASLFIEQDSRARENKVFGTAEFLEAELKKVTDQLQQSEDIMRKLKQRYRYELPTERATNSQTLDRLQTQRNGNLEALDRYVTLQMNLERQIAETPPMIADKPAHGSVVAAAKPNPLVETYRKKELEYTELCVKAKPTHPDVRRLKAELDQLRQEIPPEELAALEVKDNTGQAAAPPMVPNPVYQSLTSQLSQMKTDIAIREREKKWIEDEMVKYNARLQNTPGVEQEMLAITRTNDELTKQHDDLKKKLEEAKLAGSLESRQKGAQFEIIDPANYPLEPSPPGRSVILLVGLGVSLVIGIATAVIVNSMNQQIWTHQELERAFDAPVLVEIPSIISPLDIRNTGRKRLIHAFLFIIFAGIYLGGIYCLYVKQSTILRLLDPIIEQIAEKAAG